MGEDHLAGHRGCRKVIAIKESFRDMSQVRPLACPLGMSALMPLMDHLESGKFVQSIKHGCELAGLRPGGVRAPLQPLDDAEKETLARVVADLQRDVAAAVNRTAH